MEWRNMEIGAVIYTYSIVMELRKITALFLPLSGSLIYGELSDGKITKLERNFRHLLWLWKKGDSGFQGFICFRTLIPDENYNQTARVCMYLYMYVGRMPIRPNIKLFSLLCSLTGISPFLLSNQNVGRQNDIISRAKISSLYNLTSARATNQRSRLHHFLPSRKMKRLKFVSRDLTSQRPTSTSNLQQDFLFLFLSTSIFNCSLSFPNFTF